MRMSWKTLGFLIVPTILGAALILLVAELIKSRSENVTEPAILLVEPLTKDISAELGWQNSGVLLESGSRSTSSLSGGDPRWSRYYPRSEWCRLDV